MPDQTPEVCAECGHTLAEAGPNSDGSNWTCLACWGEGKPQAVWRHPFRPAGPTPAERPEGWQRKREDGLYVYYEKAGETVAIYSSLERAISSAAVAAYVRREDGLRGNLQFQIERAQAAERALEEAREAIREWARGDMGHLPFEDGSGCQRCLRPWPCSNARLRALVSTEGREEGGER